MAEQRGQPLIVWTLLIFLWFAVRAGVGDADPEITIAASIVATTPQAPAPQKRYVSGQLRPTRLVAVRTDPARSFLPPVSLAGVPSPSVGRASSKFAAPAFQLPPPQAALQRKVSSPRLSSNLATGPIFQSGQPLDPASGNNARANDKRLQIYAYSFWRLQSSAGSGLAVAPQYGGSQSGVIATYRLTGGERTRLSLLARAALSASPADEREFAAGLRWQPDNKLPITLSAEHRFRFGAPDATAFYLAGSMDNVALPAQVRLAGFAQAGIVGSGGISKQHVTAFLDAGLKAERDLVALGPAEFSTGAGAWAGGQRGTRRLDIGPVLSAKIEVAKTAVRLDADWRFRIAGNASPGNGPTITVSTGF